jgi:hypothetical protein
VIAQWKLRRIYAAEKELFERKQRLSDYSAEEFDRLSRYEQRLAHEIHRCLRELKATSEARAGRRGRIDCAKRTHRGSQLQPYHGLPARAGGAEVDELNSKTVSTGWKPVVRKRDLLFDK